MAIDLNFAPPAENRSPLVKFRGKLAALTQETFTPEGGGNARVRVKFQFTDLEVIESTEPYLLPIAEISIGYSNRSETAWAALAASCRKLLPTPDPNLLEGKTQVWHYTTARLRVNRDGEWVTADDAKAWQVEEIEGYGSADEGGKDLMTEIVSLLDGKDESAFNNAFFTSAELKRLPGYQDALNDLLNDRGLYKALESGGLVAKDADGIYHKVGS